MSRLTGNEVANLMEAYSAVYAPQQEEIVENVEQIDEAQIVPAAAKVNQQTTKPRPGESAADARTRAGAVEYTRRGGLVGQLGRTLTRGFGSAQDIKNVDAADKASQARINQRVAAAQGKYYSSSDQKTYRNYNDAVAARNSRLNVKPKPEPDAGDGAGDRPANTKTTPAASSTVLAKQGGVEGKLDKATGKFTAGAFTGAERDRYVARGGSASPSAPKPPATGTLGSTSFERRTPTSTELKAAQSARETGASPEKALQAAKIAGAGEKAASAPTTNQTPTAFKAAPLTTSAATAAASNPKAPDTATTFSQKTAATPKPVENKPTGFDLAKKNVNLAAGVDLFDIIKGHLLDEGYAETEEAAIAIMANMGEEWRESIVEAKYGTKAGRKALAKKIRAGKNIGKKGPGTGFKAVEKAAEKGGAEDPAAVAAAQMWKTYGK